MHTIRHLIALSILLIILPGCGREDDKSKQRGAGADAKKTTSPPVVKLTEADDRDDPKFSLLFPASGKIGEWVKTRAVRGSEKLDVILPEFAAVLAPYAPEIAATATYQRVRDSQRETLTAYLIRAATTDDAYGMMSVVGPGPDRFDVGDVSRVGRSTAYAIRGQYLGVFQGRDESSGPQVPLDDVVEFASKTMFNLAGRGGPPMLVQMLQSGRPDIQTLFLHDLTSLTAHSDLLEYIGLSDVNQMNKLLELGPDVELAVVLCPVENWDGDNVIWIAKYPTSEQAAKVYNAYREVIGKPGLIDKIHKNTMLKKPRGRYLLGCWTAESESLGHMMQKAYQLLP